MKLSAFGEIAARFWHDLPHHFPHVRLDAFVVMPDHVHGILVIDDMPNNAPPVEKSKLGVSTPTLLTPYAEKNRYGVFVYEVV